MKTDSDIIKISPEEARVFEKLRIEGELFYIKNGGKINKKQKVSEEKLK